MARALLERKVEREKRKKEKYKRKKVRKIRGVSLLRGLWSQNSLVPGGMQNRSAGQLPVLFSDTTRPTHNTRQLPGQDTLTPAPSHPPLPTPLHPPSHPPLFPQTSTGDPNIPSAPQQQRQQKDLPATELGRGIKSEEVVWQGYGTGPCAGWLGGGGAEGLGGGGAGGLGAAEAPVLGGSLLEGASLLPGSSSATGEQVSGRTLGAGACWALTLPSLLHSRLEPLRSSFSEELVMVAVERERGRERERGGGEERETVITTMIKNVPLLAPRERSWSNGRRLAL